MPPVPFVTTDPASIVVLRSLNGRPCAKVIRSDARGYQVTPYGKETQWWPEVYPARTFGELASSLEAMTKRDDIIVVTGALPSDLHLIPRIGVMRRLAGGPSSGGHFFPAPRSWVAIDIDGACPAPDAASDEEALRVLRSALPERFNDVACFYQFTSSHMLSGSALTLRVRLWFKLDGPVDSARWKALFAPIRSELCIDTSIYMPVQPIFVCPPRFVDGAEDPVFVRFGTLAGERELVPTTGLPDAPSAEADTALGAAIDGEGNEEEIDAAICRVLGQRTTGSRHHHIIGVACELVGISCPPAKMLPVLNELIRAQGREPQPREALNAVTWARKKATEGKLVTQHPPATKVFPDHIPPFVEPQKGPHKTPLPPGVDDDGFVPPAEYGNHSFLNATAWLRTHYPQGGLVRWQENDYEWDGSCYRRPGDIEWLKSKVTNTTSTKSEVVTKTVQSIRGIAYHPAPKAPFWISDPWREAGNYLSFKNGVLDIDAWMLNPGNPMLPHDRDLFTLAAAPYEYDPDAKCPQFDRWLEDLFPGDQATQHEYKKMLGYCLLPDNRMQKMFVLQGPRRSGKGLTLGIIEQLVGTHNMAAADFNLLESNFGLAPLVGKRIAVMGEVEENTRINARVVSRLKAIAGNDAVPIDRKGRDVIMQPLSCRFVICCNQLPRFLDPSGALAARIVLFPFSISYAGREDWDLPRRLLGERPGILNRALEGMRALAMEGRFLPTAAAKRLMAEFEEVMNPAGTFFAEHTEPRPGYVIKIDDLYRAYQAWAVDSQLHPITKPGLSNYVSQHYPQCESFRPRTDSAGKETGPSRPKCFRGIALSPSGLEWLRVAGPDANAFSAAPPDAGT